MALFLNSMDRVVLQRVSKALLSKFVGKNYLYKMHIFSRVDITRLVGSTRPSARNEIECRPCWLGE